MNVPILLVLKYLALWMVCYYVPWLIWRFIIHPEYRWHQRGNICYDERRAVSLGIGAVIFVITLLIAYDILTFSWK